MSQPSGNMQTFVIAVIVVTGTFLYLMIVTILGRSTDPTILPILAGATGTVLSYFFAQHIANGASAHALDVLMQTTKEREATIAANSLRPETSQPPSGGSV